MPSDSAPDPWLRPVWEDEDEPSSPPHRSPAAAAGLDPALLAPLCAAQDALARLDAKAEAAPAPVRAGLIARLAFREAAGWLATVGAWVHPRDLALRTAHLIGLGDRPNTPGHHWDEMDPATRLLAEDHAQTALALARLLRHPAAMPHLLADPDAAALTALAGACDPDRLGRWRARWVAPDPRVPALLTAAQAAADWMGAGITQWPSPVAALAASAALLARGTLRTVPLPVWAAAPVLAIGEPDALPRLRGEAARRLFPGTTPPWPAVFLSLVAEAARAGLRELDRLHAAAGAGTKLAAGIDKRGRFPGALEAVLREPVVTPKGLARQLQITPQAALRLLAQLRAAGIVRETTGRRSFRAFAV